MTPEELAAMRAGLDPRAYYQDPYAAARAGLVDPESLPPRGATPILSGVPTPPGPGLREQAEEVIGKGKQKLREGKVAAQDFLKRYPQVGGYARLGTAALAAAPAIGTSLEELEEGRPLGAVAALAPAGLSVIGAGMLGRTGQALIGKGGLPGTALGLGLMGLGAILPGAAASGAEAVKRKATGEPITGKEDFNNQLARARQLNELGTTQYRDNMGVYTSGLMDLNKAISDQEYLNLQRNIPLINQLKNAELVRSQALINTQNQAYLQQGVVATAGALATGAQQQTGATVRQALAANPYNIALQSPAISFG